MQDRFGHSLRRAKAAKIRRIGRKIFRAVVKERRRHRLFFGNSEFRGIFRREQRDADTVRPP